MRRDVTSTPSTRPRERVLSEPRRCRDAVAPRRCGQAMFGHVGEGAAGGELTPPVVVLTVLYSLAGLGIAIVNDFKSIEGDRELGLKSLPVAFGIDGAKYICAGLIDVTQIAVAAYLFAIGLQTYALVLGLLIAPQIWAQTQYLLKDPVKYDVKCCA